MCMRICVGCVSVCVCKRERVCVCTQDMPDTENAVSLCVCMGIYMCSVCVYVQGVCPCVCVRERECVYSRYA